MSFVLVPGRNFFVLEKYTCNNIAKHCWTQVLDQLINEYCMISISSALIDIDIIIIRGKRYYSNPTATNKLNSVLWNWFDFPCIRYQTKWDCIFKMTQQKRNYRIKLSPLADRCIQTNPKFFSHRPRFSSIPIENGRDWVVNQPILHHAGKLRRAIQK